MFLYIFKRLQVCSSRKRTANFVSVRDVPIQSRFRIESVREDTASVGWSGIGDLAGGVLIHVDAITHKVKLAPHFNSDLSDTYMCAIPMWEAI